jgi:hypothetical protein
MTELTRLFEAVNAADCALEEQIRSIVGRLPADYRPGLAAALADYQNAGRALRVYLSGTGRGDGTLANN